ncbi:MAG: radical SAM protein [Deltaproteobacteria bacterium]
MSDLRKKFAGDMVSLYRAILAREKGTVIKDWGGRIAVALVYPNSYRIGMSNLGFQVVYRILNERDDVAAERAFLPEGQEMSLYLQTGKPLLSLESQSPLRNFHLIAFSLSFENDYPNLLKILEMAKVSILAEERSEPFPMVIAGGVAAFLNPEPLAPFVDCFLLGEAEASLNPFIDLLAGFAPRPPPKEEMLKGLAARARKGLYVPSLYQPEYHEDGTLKSFLPKGNGIPEKIRAACSDSTAEAGGEVAVSAITTPDTEFSDMVLVELGRGCGRSCRFCAAGYVYRPPRTGRAEALREAIEKALRRTDRVGLLSAAVSDTPGIEALTEFITERGGHFSVSSLRANSLTKGLLVQLKRSGQKSLAIAPEAGSDRLRRVLNKHLTRDQIVEAVRLISRTGDFTIRLYFMLGLPTETKEDVYQIHDLVKKIKHHMVKESASRGRIGQIKLSVNCFVPKPFTPFQWLPFDPVPSLKEKQRWLKRSMSKEGGVKVNFDVPKWAYLQALLSRGDRRVAPMLLKAHQWEGDWPRVFRSSKVNPDFFVYRPREANELLPWDFIDHGIWKGHLRREFDLALKAQESDVCRVGECYRCGVCSRMNGSA